MSVYVSLSLTAPMYQYLSAREEERRGEERRGEERREENPKS